MAPCRKDVLEPPVAESSSSNALCSGKPTTMGLQATVATTPPPLGVSVHAPLKRKHTSDDELPIKKLCKEDAEDSRPPSALEDMIPACVSTNEEDKENVSDSSFEFNKDFVKTVAKDGDFDTILAKTPKVIVEHQPLPSIYELQHVACDTDVLSDDSMSGSDEDDDLADPKQSSNAAKALYHDRFWNQGALPQPPTPPPNAFQFLEQTNQRIECAENGKSYLQLGTMNHHHIPVTPVIQPKPNMVYRRPIPPFRNPATPPPSPAVRPVCDHSNCLQRKASLCYRAQRSRMLNLSLHKLHMARQNHEGCLRRSVLICNMLKHIEDETEQEQAAQAAQASVQNNYDQTETGEAYWEASPPFNSQAPPTPNPYASTETYESTLKDFNSAFRPTPYSSPSPHTDLDSGLVDDDRGVINWGSVLSLSNQSELDPLNNNTFADFSSAEDSLGHGTFADDIGWKLSADDVIKAFPNDENLFVASS